MNVPNKRTRLKTRGKVFLFGIIAAFGQIAQAAEAPSAYVMTVILDQAQGDQLLRGSYGQAIESLTADSKRPRFAENNNLCVAYTKTNNLPEAEQACSAALRNSKPLFGLYDLARKTDHAVALSNRGVIHAVSGDLERAKQDFRAAIKVNRYLTAAAENLAILEAKTTEAVSALQ
jgi:tetratricopeptide (TPR) repeat protein